MEKKFERIAFDLNDYMEVSAIIKIVNGADNSYCPHQEQITEAYKLYEDQGSTREFIEKVFKTTHQEETFKYNYNGDISGQEISGIRTRKINGEIKETSFCLFKVAEDLDGNHIYSVIINNKFKCTCQLILSGFYHKFDVVHLSGFRLVESSTADQMTRALKQNHGPE